MTELLKKTFICLKKNLFYRMWMEVSHGTSSCSTQKKPFCPGSPPIPYLKKNLFDWWGGGWGDEKVFFETLLFDPIEGPFEGSRVKNK